MMIPSLTETSIPSLIQWIIGTSIVIAVVISNQGFKEEHKANKNSLLVLKKFLWNYYLKQFNKEEQDIIIGDQAGGSGNNRHRYQIDKGSINTDIIRHDERVHRKNEFLQSILNDGYGYKSSKRGHIDTWRYEEFPTLLRPINAQSHVLEKKQDSSKDENVQLQEVYLDYAGSSIPSLSLLNHTHQLSMEYQILANPHSSGVAASRSMEMIEKVKMKVQTFFGAEAGPLFGFDDDDTNNDTPDYHPGYDIIFTSGATEALRIVGEHFQWTGDSDRSCCQKGVNRASNSSCCDSSKQSIFLYPPNVHTSVIGIREFALAAGATFRCKERSSFDSVDDNIFQQSCCEHSTEEFNNKNNTINHLLALPLECNFDGSKIDAKAIIKASRCDKCSAGKEKNPNTNHQWFTILDIAKAASTQSINLREIDPDFACVSFYKIFGHPTGMGALFVKRTSMHAILPIKNNQLGEKKTRTYFGGGAVDIVLPRTDFVSPRSNSSILSSFIHGTMNFRNAVSLFAGFDEIESLGGMKEINVHTKCLAIEAVKQLKRLQHENGVDVIKLYGPWSCFEIDNLSLANFYKLPGPTIAFNVIRQDGSFVGYNEVTKLAALYQNPIQLRTGCFCNPGACQDALALSDDEVKDNFLRGGHVCGDEIDIVDGIPTGAVRTSFGRDSIWEDLDSLVSFLKRTFISHKDSKSEKITKILLQEEATLSEIYVYPIKSCGAMDVKEWKMNQTSGALVYDREFALIDSTGAALRLSTYPKMGLIRPYIDLDNKTLTVKATGLVDLVVDLDVAARCSDSTKAIKVCGTSECGGRIWGDHSVSQWFTSVLGVQCWLVRYVSESSASPTNQVRDSDSQKNLVRSGFENECPILLISQNSVDALNGVIWKQGSKLVNSKYFRPNFVVKQPLNTSSNPEDEWSEVIVPRSKTKLSVVGQCARCSMVDIDPSSGMKGGKTLRALAEYRRQEGRINFGIFLSPLPYERVQKEKYVVLCVGERFIIK